MTDKEALDRLEAAVATIVKQRDKLVPLAAAIVKGFDCDPGHSDLDDEQPIIVRMKLGDYRKAEHFFLTNSFSL